MARRFSGVDLYDDQGFLVARRPAVEVGYTSINGIRGFGYRAYLKPLESRFAAAHTSWVNDQGGVLMLDDLLPQSLAKKAVVSLELPAGWNAVSVDHLPSMEQTTPLETDRTTFTAANIEKGVIFIGPADRRRVVRSGRARLVLNQRGEWQFDTDEALS
ncbi:MAG: hypothetical protein AB7J13_09790, partial [Pyrinomonadaceae bacterium]